MGDCFRYFRSMYEHSLLSHCCILTYLSSQYQVKDTTLWETMEKFANISPQELHIQKKFCLEEVPLFIYGLYPIQCSCTQESHPYDSAKQLLCRILQYKNPSTKVSGGTFPLHEARTLPASVGCTAVVTFVALHLQWFCQCCVLASMLLLLYSTTYSLCFGT